MILEILSEKEERITFLEKKKPEFDGEVIIKYKEITNPSEEAVSFLEEMSIMKDLFTSTLKEIDRLKTEKKELLAINFTLSTELNQVRDSKL